VITDLPNLLTLSRILAIPLVVAAFYLRAPWDDWVPFGLFTYASVTDFLDGYLARTRGQMSPLGRFLDPIADKLLVATVILLLVALDRIDGWHVLPAIVILLREILVSGLREFLAEVRVSVPVSQLAKWKTGIQMLALGFLLAGDSGNGVMPAALPATTVGEYALWVAAILTLYTGYDYLRAGRAHL
jgi:cardiolipin synthase